MATVLSIYIVVHAICSSGYGLKMYRPPARDFKNNGNSFTNLVPGIEYISRGYNIMFGNPHTTGNVDQGISGSIFSLLNCSDGQTYKTYNVPNGVSVLESPTCVEKFTYNAITGVNSYSSSLTQDTSFDTKAFGAAFSASVDYQSVYKTTTTTKNMYTSSYTQCACYAASLNAPYDLPSFTSNFYETIYHLPDNYDENNETNAQFFYDFFSSYFGTHYITGITMGGIFGTISSMEETSYSKFSSSNLEVDVSASYSTLGASAAASSMTDTQKTQASDFDSITKSKQIFNIGGNLPSNNNAATWQQTLASNPLPIYYKWETIPTLLTSTYFPEIKSISKKQSALQSALNAYCQLLATNETFGKIDCEGYPPDPSLPGKSVIKGAYSSNIDAEPKNPYTGGYSCNTGFEPILYSSYWDTNIGQEFNNYYCYNSTMNKHDGLDYFGGFYENCVEGDDSHGVCNKVNMFTNACSCPSGYESISISDGFTSVYNSNCPECGSSSLRCAQTFVCFNPKISLTETIMGGMYSTNTKNDGCGPGWPNFYTKTLSCPSGFTAYKTGEECCYDDNGKCGATRSTYMCLNNIYPV